MNGIKLAPLQGPLCYDPGPEMLSYCYHDSCQTIEINDRITFAFGPICESKDYLGQCFHTSCEAVEPDQEFCATHGWQLVEERRSGRGFAGGQIYWTVMKCGCVDLDETDDVRAAY